LPCYGVLHHPPAVQAPAEPSTVRFGGKMPHTIRRSLIPVIACLALLPAGQGLASAAPTGVASPAPAAQPTDNHDPQSTDNLDAHTMAIMRQQEALQPVVTILYDEVAKSPNSGFTSLAFEGDGVSLFWKGELTDGMARAVAAARLLGPVRVRPAAHSKAELTAAAAQIDAASAGGDIQAIILNHDGSGVGIVKMPPSLANDLVRDRGGSCLDHEEGRAGRS
jgi:hypothetical protein